MTSRPSDVRRADFHRVADFLKTQGVNLSYDEDRPIYPGGHRIRQLAEEYAVQGPTDKEKQDG